MKYIVLLLLLFNPALQGLYTDKNKLVEVENTEVIPYVSDETEYHIILVEGQSNTLWGTGFDPNIDTSGYRVYQLGRNGEDNFRFVQCSRLQHYTANPNKISFGTQFANKYKDSIANKVDAVIVIPCGRGGIGFTGNFFNKGEEIYEDALARLKFIQNIYPSAKIEAVLWHQGEADINNPDYETEFIAMYDSMFIDFDLDSVPFIVGGMSPLWVETDSAAQVQQGRLENWQNERTWIGWCSPYLPDTIKDVNVIPDDIVHYNATGQREMAERYFQEFKQMKGL